MTFYLLMWTSPDCVTDKAQQGLAVPAKTLRPHQSL
jgi:hypothetical protein